MKVIKGTNRIVVPLPSLNIAIKFPIIYMRVGLNVFWHDLRVGGGRLYKELFVYSIYSLGSLKRLLFKGVIDNWKEYQFYQDTRHPFLQPTLFSFFGLVNIQVFGEPCTLEEIIFWRQIKELTSGLALKDGHHLMNPANFSLNNRVLTILDYGGPRTQEVVREFGEKIIKNFNPDYNWEERKRSLRDKDK